QTLFMDTGIFTHMEELIDALRNNNDGEINTALDNLSKSIDDIQDYRSALGAISNGLRMTMNKTTLEELNITGLRSKLEDIDFAETFMYYSTMAVLYEASLAAGARIMVPSLIDFLR
ncbi:MAG: flagellar hook-associated protein FlgL, partial [Firmicutes bacterium]|nr:flagellar hook-associated protein FlgL [Bacillota bacterium]